MKKLIINYTGGLGNQLFQYAAAKNLFYAHSYKLFSFKNDLKKQQHTFQLNALDKNKIPIYIKILIYISRLIKKNFLFNFHVFEENKFYLDKKINLNSKKNYFLKGYWQGINFFCQNLNKIIKEINLNIINKKINKSFFKNKNNLMIHIRRGDYLDKKNLLKHGVLDKFYYIKAINYIQNLLNKKLNIIIFTDDINWARKKFIFLEKKIFYDKNFNNPKDVLSHMKYCDHFILSNSTFSWWAAYLAHNKNKIVVIPKNWYLDKRFSSSNLKLKNWRVL
jgi:hypothetical protein